MLAAAEESRRTRLVTASFAFMSIWLESSDAWFGMLALSWSLPNHLAFIL